MAALAIQANLAADAANAGLSTAGTIVAKFGKVLAEYKKIVNNLFKPSIIETQFNEIENSANEQIVKNTEKNIANAETPQDILKAIEEGKSEIKKMQTAGQRGGKKILSRTNKSIAQFLNSKVTFQSILKRMTSKYKMGGKRETRGTRRRLYKR